MTHLRFPFLACFLAVVSFLSGQTSDIDPTPASIRQNAFELRQTLANNPFNAVQFRNIGPTVFSGRVADIAVSPKDPSQFYVAYASGGLWKTESNGTRFTPLFDQEAVMTIGAIAVNWNENIIWVGTGEVNSSRSSYAGLGVYKSTDQGESWTYCGLPESHHIGRIVLHPTDPNTAWVAVLGHLYSPNQERGVYKTTDGGITWQHTLQIDQNTGVVDLVIDPSNPTILYAASWQRSRQAWNFEEAGPGSGIFKSVDGGNYWKKITSEEAGFPSGEGTGRIGLSISKNGDQTILLALLDNYFRREKEAPDPNTLTKDELRSMSKKTFLQLPKYKIIGFLNDYGAFEKYKADDIIEKVKNDEIKPQTLVEFLEDANSMLFDTPVKGMEIYRSTNEGERWEKTHEGYLDYVYNSYGYYFGQIRSMPNNPNKIYVMGVPILRSDDGGANFQSINGDNVHVDHHALWVNPQRPGHLILGNDGGINISYDDGESWFKCNSPSVGQFYAINVDMAEPYNVYGGLQDNGVWFGPNTYEASDSWHGSGDYPYDRIMGGDGMEIMIDTRTNETVYTGYQFGNYFRIQKYPRKLTYITPRHELGERPYRWNWQTPIHLSRHNQDILYMGGNFLFRSFNQGDDFDVISPDLTKGGRKGDVPYGTLSTIHESPLQFGLLYTGSDDGLIHVSKDAGYSWKLISADLPQNMWISKVQASAHKKERVYASLNGYRWDHFTAYVFMSDDYGETWTRLGQDIPVECVNVIIEDPVNENLLFVGTDHGLYVSLNKGKSFHLLNNGIPAVPIHDLVIHPRENELVVGTHGRSLYLADIVHLQLLSAASLDTDFLSFDLSPGKYSSRLGNKRALWAEEGEAKYQFPVYAKQGGKVAVKISFTNKETVLPLFKESYSLTPGVNYLSYDYQCNESTMQAYEEALNADRKEEDPPISLKKADNGKLYLYKGKYTVEFVFKGNTQTKEWDVK